MYQLTKHALVAFFWLAGVGGTSSLLEARDIRVKGQAEVQVRPDHVVLQLGVETWNRALGAAREENDRNLAAVLDEAASHGISDDSVKVDFAQVEIQRSPQLKTVVDYYSVRRTVVLTLREIDRFEDVLMDTLAAGANHIHNVDFRTSRLRAHADEARALALRAAYEKASDLASVGGFRVSERPSDVFSAETSVDTWYQVSAGDRRSPWRGVPVMQNVVSVAGTASPAERDWVVPSSGVGYLAVRATLDVEFEIEPGTR